MKGVLVALLFATSAIAQTQPGVLTKACGPEETNFKTKMDATRHALEPPEQGKARVYFIHEAGTTIGIGYPTSRIGMDGAWVGANHLDSYFSVSVDPGEHHLCATVQSSLRAAAHVELAHFQAEAGKVYYYRTRLISSGNIDFFEIDPIDSDQGEYLIASFPWSDFQPKGTATPKAASATKPDTNSTQKRRYSERDQTPPR